MTTTTTVTNFVPLDRGPISLRAVWELINELSAGFAAGLLKGEDDGDLGSEGVGQGGVQGEPGRRPEVRGADRARARVRVDHRGEHGEVVAGDAEAESRHTVRLGRCRTCVRRAVLEEFGRAKEVWERAEEACQALGLGQVAQARAALREAPFLETVLVATCDIADAYAAREEADREEASAEEADREEEGAQ